MATQKGRNWSSGDIVTAANLGSIERGVSAVAEEYTPTTWANGNTVTAAGLNNIEQGIVNAGGGSSDFSIAHVKVNYTLDGEPFIPTLSDGQEVDIYNNEFYIVISFYYGDVFGDGHLHFPVSDLGTATQLNLPLYKNLKTDGGLIFIEAAEIGTTSIYSSNPRLTCTIVSGDATISDGRLLVTGDCEINVDWVTNGSGN